MFLSYDQNVEIGEFDGGIAYIDEGEENAFKSYKITRQFSDRIELSNLIDPSKQEDGVKDVEKGQTVRLVPATGLNTVWMNYSKEWGEDELNDSLIRVLGASSNVPENEGSETGGIQNTFVVIDSDETSFKIGGASPYLLRSGDEVYVDNIVLSPLISFSGRQTSIDSDHYHQTNMVSKFLSGAISEINIYGASQVDITPKTAESIDNDLIGNYPTLLAGADILIFDPYDPRMSYRKEIVSIQGGVIRVKKGDPIDWDFNNSFSGISTEWKWIIDSRRYGVSSQPILKDFIVFKSRLSSDSLADGTSIVAEDVSGVEVGDKIELWDLSGNTFSTEVAGVLGNTIEIVDLLPIPFFVSNGSHIRIRRSSWEASAEVSSTSSTSRWNHFHCVKDGEISLESVEEFVTNGYPYSHSHQLKNLIGDVKVVSYEYDTNTLLVAGNNSKIYSTRDGGQNWGVLVDASSLFGDWDGSFVSMSRSFDGDLFAGTNDGRFVGQGVPEENSPLVYPENGQLLPSSSSSSSSSSISSISSSSESSSMTSRSSSTVATYSTSSTTESSSKSSSSESSSFFKSSDSSESTVVQGE